MITSTGFYRMIDRASFKLTLCEHGYTMSLRYWCSPPRSSRPGLPRHQDSREDGPGGANVVHPEPCAALSLA